MIEFDGVDKTFPTNEGEISLLESTTISIPEGSFTAIMGPSGSGKTTFLNLIAGLIRPDEGFIDVNGTRLNDLGPDEMTLFRGKQISFVFQKFHLLPQLTVEENVDLVIELNDLERRYTTSQILAKVGLAGREKTYPDVLSGGEQQRVALARAFVGDTPIILADEPTGNLDQKTAKVIMNLIKELHEEVHKTIVMITHDPNIAAYAQTTYHVQDKTLLQSTPTGQ